MTFNINKKEADKFLKNKWGQNTLFSNISNNCALTTINFKEKF